MKKLKPNKCVQKKTTPKPAQPAQSKSMFGVWKIPDDVVIKHTGVVNGGD